MMDFIAKFIGWCVILFILFACLVTCVAFA